MSLPWLKYAHDESFNYVKFDSQTTRQQKDVVCLFKEYPNDINISNRNDSAVEVPYL